MGDEIPRCPNCRCAVELVPDGVECTGRHCGYRILRGNSLNAGQLVALATHKRIAAALRILEQQMTRTCVVVDVPGCTCHEHTKTQLDRADVCPACVSYFDLHDGTCKGGGSNDL